LDTEARSRSGVVVGALEALIDYPDQGAAYVYVETKSGWVQSLLTAFDAAGGNVFGTSVAISDDTILDGSPGNQIGSNVVQGAGYLFVKPASGWTTMTERLRRYLPQMEPPMITSGHRQRSLGSIWPSPGGHGSNYKDSAVYIFGPQ
jgi:FG-GAP repeat